MIGLLRKLGLASNATTRKPASERTVPEIAQSVVSKVIWDWPDSKPFRVEAVLKSHPQLADSARAMIDLAVEEYADRRDAGEELSPTLFAKRFPHVQTELLDSLLFENAIEEMTDWFRGVLEPPADEEIHWPETGEEVAGLRLVEPLGRGGFSRVFLAEDLEYENRRMAVKICRDDTHETQTLAGLQHSGIGIVHYVRRIPERGLVAICMPFASRTTLHDVLKSVWQNGCPTTPDNAWREIASRNGIDRETPLWAGQDFTDWVHELAISMGHAIASSHEQDIVHCDIKPSNVLVTAEGTPIVIDFNVAFRHSAQSSPANVGGTLPFMAPEQIRAFAGAGYSEIGPHTDVFGIGATLYQLLTGHLPFGETVTADDGIAPLLEARKTPPASIRASNPTVSAELDALILSCLNYEVADRPADAQTLASELERLRYNQRPRKTVHRDRAVILVVAAATLLLALQIPGADDEENNDTPQALLQAGIGAIEQQPREQAAVRERPVEVVPAAGLHFPIPKTQELVDAGIAAFDQGLKLRGDATQRESMLQCFAEAERNFRRAALGDDRHKGAFIGLVRSILHQGRLSNASTTGASLVVDQTAETNAFQGLCHAAGRNFRMAAEKLDAAIRGGFDTHNARLLLAYSRFYSNDFDGATKLLNKLHEQQEAPVPLINLVLAQATMMQAMSTGTPLGADATDRIERLLDECPRGIERGMIGADICAALGVMQGPSDATAHVRWSERAVDEFRSGVQHGLDPQFWKGLRGVLDQTVAEASEFNNIPPGNGLDRGPLILPMLDPFMDVPTSQLRRWDVKPAPLNQPVPEQNADPGPQAVVAQSN